MSWPKHGANPQYLYEKMNLIMPDEQIDFSVNLNPFGPPESILQAWQDTVYEIEHYPDPLGMKLKEKISSKFNLSTEEVLLGNGAAELIQLLAIMFKKEKVAIFQPTFSEYERMCRAFEAEISYAHVDNLFDETELLKLTKQNKAIFLCHPNNPTGEIYPREMIIQLIEKCERNDCFLILDEAFYDFVLEDISVVNELQNYRKLIILQSLTKMYAVAGLRLGVCFANKAVIEVLRKHQPYWSVNGIALKMGELLLDQGAYVARTAQFVKAQGEHYFPKIEALGYKLSQSVVNYFLLKDPKLTNQSPLLRFLLKQGIIPRHTENYPYLKGEYLRFSVRKSEDMDILLEALKKWQEN